MNKQIRQLGGFLMLCFLALFVQLNYVQVLRAGELNRRPGNSRPVDQAFSRRRGTVSSADGALLARSDPSKDRYKFQRVFPESDLFGFVTGYFNFDFGATGIESVYNSELSGNTAKQKVRSLSDLFVDHERTGNLTLTIRKDVQQVARLALGSRKGSVVALDPKNGDIIAFWSFPSFDPNALSQHPQSKDDPSSLVKRVLEASPEKPLLARMYRETFFPGSTFKVVTASVGVQSGQVTPNQPSYPVVSSYTPPQTRRPLKNFGGESCGGTLFDILAKSCNSAFAQMGVDLGPLRMVDGAQAFGFNERAPIDLPAPGRSRFPTDFTQNLPRLAQSSVGQNDVSATPLQMALIAAGIANNGQIMVPHLLDQIRDSDGNVIRHFDPKVWKQPVTPQNADIVRQAMVQVVQRGTATGLAIPGMEVGGKTGTAQLGTTPPKSHAWIIGWAGPAGQPKVAVAVIVEAQPGEVSDATGGRIAAPIARAVMEKALQVRGG